jgi:hypothetical protein
MSVRWDLGTNGWMSSAVLLKVYPSSWSSVVITGADRVRLPDKCT